MNWCENLQYFFRIHTLVLLLKQLTYLQLETIQIIDLYIWQLMKVFLFLMNFYSFVKLTISLNIQEFEEY